MNLPALHLVVNSLSPLRSNGHRCLLDNYPTQASPSGWQRELREEREGPGGYEVQGTIPGHSVGLLCSSCLQLVAVILRTSCRHVFARYCVGKERYRQTRQEMTGVGMPSQRNAGRDHPACASFKGDPHAGLRAERDRVSGEQTDLGAASRNES